MNKSSKKKTIFTISISSIMFIIGIVVTIIVINIGNRPSEPDFKYNASHYINDRDVISTSSLTSQYTKMSSLYINNGSEITRSEVAVETNKTIAIETAMDFYAFMVLANREVSGSYPFLTYDYELLANIDMKNAYEAYPIGYNNKEFIGSFNGNGHTIKNLKLTPVTAQNVENFANTHYYALFCQNGADGVIGNFGLINPIISIGAAVAENVNANGVYYVANVVGKNSGKVSYVFVRDNIEKDVKDVKEVPGIDLIAQGYHVSGVVAVNTATGTFDNSYYASTTVISSSNTKPAEFQELLLENKAKDSAVSNLFFYDSLIDNYASTAVKYGGFLDKTFNYTKRFGTYCTSISNLNESVLRTNGVGQENTWYTDANYKNIGDLSSFFDSVLTPLTRGFISGQVTYDVNGDGKYHVTISNANDLSYIYELMDVNSKFASNAFIYEIDANINLDNVLSPNYNKGIAATFTTKNATDSTKIEYYKTLYLKSFSYKVSTLGIDAYGVFPYLTGTVKYLNFVVGTAENSLEFDQVSNNIIAYGAIAGYVEGGTIESCNVYNNFTINSKVGKYFVGGAVGMVAGEGTVEKVTSNGTINATNNNAKTPNNPTGYPNGTIIGGVVGYIDSSLGSVDTLYSETNIKSNGYTNNEVIIGGVVGAGYTKNANRLQNNGNITLSSSAYSKLYVAGVIGRLLGVSSQISLFTNNGDITVAQTNGDTYVCGILNADIQTTSAIAESLFKEKSVHYFYGSSMTNGSNITITGSNTSSLIFTDVINVMSNNGFKTKLSGIYNLNYKFKAPSTALGAQTINPQIINTFAPVLRSDSANTNDSIDLTTAYNLRDITIDQSGAVSDDLLYTGCVLGQNINYEDVRNEGKISFEVKNDITGDIKIFGVFEEVSNNKTAKVIYNGGDIELKVKADITGDIYVSGICYSNVKHTNSSFYTNGNPLDTTFDKNYRGTLDNVINAGKITYGLNDILTNNNKTVSGTVSSYRVVGNVLVSGISILNESSITNTFNLGDILSVSGFRNVNTDAEKTNDDKRSVASGIVCVQSGANASIINSANNGEIKNINMSNTGYIYAGGIVGKNDQTISFGNITSTNNNHSEVVAFTINYGIVLAFNGKENSEMTTTSFSYGNVRSVASGILASGLCNIVNVVNYGKVYGSQLSSGIMALCDFSKFSSEVTTNSHVTIANCLTYAPSYEITPSVSIDGVSNAIRYSEIRDLSTTRTKIPVILETPSAADNAYNGTVIAVINFNNSVNAQYIDIRYLVSFSEIVQTFRLQINTPNSVTGNTQTMYSANKNQMYLGSGLVYSPLSTASDDLGNVGIFNENFRFRKAINGKLDDGTIYYNTTTYVTDLYLTNYFEFVGFTKVNPYILGKIGWDTISYASAASDFAKNLDELEIVLKSYEIESSSSFEDVIENSFNTSTWIQYCDKGVLSDLLNDILNAQDLSSLKTITNYLFFTSSNKSVITQSMREEFAQSLISYFESSEKDIRVFLDSIMTSEVIAEIIAGNEYDNQVIQDIIKGYIDALEDDEIQSLVYKYLEYLEDLEEDHFDELFNTYKSYYSKEKIALLTALLSDLDPNIIVDLVSELDTSAAQSTSYKLKIALDSLNDAQKTTLYNQFINDLSNNSSSVVATAENAISKLLDSYNISLYTEETDTEVSTFADSIDSTAEKIALWNIIKNDSSVLTYLDNYYKTKDMYVYDANTGVKHTGFLAKATEFRNTYQTNDHPSYYEWNYNNSTGYSSLSANTPRGASDHNRGTTGVYRASYDDEDLINRFIYTPDDLVTDGTVSYRYTYNNINKDVTPKTYYYGPYLSDTVLSDKHGQLWNYNASQGAVGIGRNLKVNTSGGAITKSYIPIFISLDEQFVNDKILETSYGSMGIDGISTATSFIWNNNSFYTSRNGGTKLTNNDSQSQWVSVDIMTKKPDNNQYVLKKDHSNYSSVRYGFNYDLAGLTNSGELKNYGLSYNGVTNNSGSFDKNDIVYAYCTATMITGIYYELSQWEKNGLFITAKENNQGLFGVVTTQYIDYTIEDLVKVDGKLTKGRSTGVNSEDEINIINTVIGHLFAEPEGKSVVMTALGKHFTSAVDNIQLALNYLNSFNNNQAWKNAFVDSIPFISDTYIVATNIDGQTSVQSYLEYIYNSLSHSDYGNVIVYSLESKSNFKKILQYLLDNKYGYYSFISSIDDASFYDWFDDVGDYASDDYSLSELTYLINYIVANNNNANLDSIISGVSDSTINAILQAVLNNQYDLSGETISGYTFGNNVRAILDYNIYNATNYYSSILFDEASTVSFTTPNALSKYKLDVVAYGSGSISIDEASYNLTNAPQLYSFVLDGNKNVTLNTTSNTRIISLNLHSGTSQTNTISSTNPSMEIGDFYVNTNERTDIFNNNTIYGLLMPAGSNMKITLNNEINNQVIKIAARRANNNVTISIKNENDNTVSRNLNTAGDSILTFNQTSGKEFTITYTNYGWVINAISFDNGTTYYYFDNMINIDGTYYLTSINNASNATITAVDSVFTYNRNAKSRVANITTTFNISSNLTSETDSAQYSYNYSSNSVVLTAVSGITDIALTSYNSTNEIVNSTLYDDINANIISSGTTNNYFAYTNNVLSNQIIRDRYNEARCKYNLEVEDLPNGSITSASDKYDFFNITGTNEYYAQRVSESSSTTIVGKTFTSSLQLPNSSAANISFTAAANSYLYILAKQSNSSNLIITNNTDTYSINLNRTDKVYAINIKNAGTYRIYSSGAASNIFDIYYTTGATTTIGSIYNNTALKGTYIKSIFTSYADFYKYYNRNNLFESSTNISLTDRKYKEIVYLLYGTTYSDMDLYNKLTDSQIKTIIKELFKHQDKFLRSAIADSTNNFVTKEQLIYEIARLCQADSNFLMDVFVQANLDINNITDANDKYYSWVYRLVAAYVSTNYLMNYNELNIADSTLTETDLYTILGAINGHTYTVDGKTYTFTNSCQFISDDAEDAEINSTNFIKLMTALGHDLSSTGYGIYALSSSHGKLNGEYIPDNLNLDDMDPQYTKTDSIYTLTSEDATDAVWRGGNPSDEDDDSDVNSVNYAFYDEMKQLIKSISTTVFELNLTKDGNTYYGDIDLDNATITYYVHSLSTGTYTVSSIDLAYNAKGYDGELSTYNENETRFVKNSTFSVSAVDVSSKKFTVFAEDTTVKKVYSIIFKELSTNLTMTYNTKTGDNDDYDTTKTIAPSTNDTTVKLIVNSNNSKLPSGFDLKPYLTITNGVVTYPMDSDYVTISTLSTDHKVKEDGSAIVTMVISYKLPADTYQICLDICGAHAEVECIKEASNESAITELRFNGEPVTFNSSKQATSDILFGRAYNNIELTDVDGIYSSYYNFYLDSLTLSPNASVAVTVTKSQNLKTYRYGPAEYRLTTDTKFKQGKKYYLKSDDTYTEANVTVGQAVTSNTYYEDIALAYYYITSYVVKYVVTAENGTNKSTYYHTLTELDPYSSDKNSKYGDVYLDGNTLNTVNTSFDESETDGTKNQTRVSFERGNENYYRIKYNLSNIYTLDDSITYFLEETTESSLNSIATSNKEYRGMSVDVNEYCDAGIYSFVYKYRNTQEWGLTPHLTDGEFDGTFTRSTDTYIEYSFPRLVIEKTYSTDATLHSIVLIDAYRDVSTASTVMAVNNLRPIEGTEQKPLADKEIWYQTLMNATSQNPNDIDVGDTIDYQHKVIDYSISTYKDYYVVGTVSNAQLNNYAPTLTIDNYGMIFQSTTLKKLKYYGKGDGKQGNATDASILGDHTSEDGSTLFLYVPFTYIDPEDSTKTLDKIFLIKIEGKTLTEVYDDRYTGTGSSVASMPSNITLDYIRSLKLDENSTMPTITVSGITYTLSRSTGNTTDNPSLYMDYVGNPLDDHFWYVTYVVFSEDYVRSESNTNVKFFHTALIDVSNNVYFAINVVAPKDANYTNIRQIYITLVGFSKEYHENGPVTFEQIVVGAYVNKTTVDDVNNTITYELIYSIQIMPSAYYYFYIDLPGGYVATTKITDPNKEFRAGISSDYLAEDGIGSIETFVGAYLPPSSLVVQKIPVTITVSKGTTSDSSSWGVTTSNTYTRNATLEVTTND